MVPRSPLVSIVMPLYNKSAYVEESIASVQAQTEPRWELLVVDDCSTDDGPDRVKRIAATDERIKLLRTDKNSGAPGEPRNVATRVAGGRYMAFLDPDDMWKPEKLRLQTAWMKQTGAALSSTGYDVIDAAGQPSGQYVPPYRTTRCRLLGENTIGCLTAMYDIDQLGRRYFGAGFLEDFRLWAEILRDCDGAYGLSTSLAVYRLTPGSITSSRIATLRTLNMTFRRHMDMGVVRATAWTLLHAGRGAVRYKRTYPLRRRRSLG